MAGAVVGIVALPLSMALAIASGVPPKHGLYTAVVAGLVIAAAGGSRVQVSGPTAAFVVILAPVAHRFGVGRPAHGIHHGGSPARRHGHRATRPHHGVRPLPRHHGLHGRHRGRHRHDADQGLPRPSRRQDARRLGGASRDPLREWHDCTMARARHERSGSRHPPTLSSTHP